MSQVQVTAIIKHEGGRYVSLCPLLDVASHGETIEVACKNLQEAVKLFLESADPSDIHCLEYSEIYVTRLEVTTC